MTARPLVGWYVHHHGAGHRTRFSAVRPHLDADVVVFSSLTPHLTGPNLTDEVRKAYILQYAPVGAEVLEGDPRAGAPTGRRACDEPRHLPVARAGRPVAAA